MSFDEVRTTGLRRLEPRRSGPATAVDWGTGYEALLGLMMLAGHEPPGAYDVGITWFERMRQTAPAGLLTDAATLSAGVPTVFGHFLGLARQAAPPRDTGAVVALISALPARRLRAELLGFSASTVQGGVSSVVLERAADGDSAAERELLAAAAHDECWAENLRGILELTADEAKQLTLRVLRTWSAVFAEQERELAPRLSAQADRWRAEAGRIGWPVLVERATRGIVLDPDVAVEAVVLVPTVLGSPWVYSSDLHGSKILCCPVRERPAESAGELVALLRGLGDETRLAMLRHLSTAGPASLTELTVHLGLSKSTVHKHLMLLRAVGLVSVTMGGRRYAVRETPDLTGLLASHLETPE